MAWIFFQANPRKKIKGQQPHDFRLWADVIFNGFFSTSRYPQQQQHKQQQKQQQQQQQHHTAPAYSSSTTPDEQVWLDVMLAVEKQQQQRTVLVTAAAAAAAAAAACPLSSFIKLLGASSDVTLKSLQQKIYTSAGNDIAGSSISLAY